MKHPQDPRQMSDSLSVGLLLALAGGYLDAYTYLCRGGVFANAETGNLVLLGLELAHQNWEHALHYLYPVLAFALGVLMTDVLRSRFFPAAGPLHWRQLVLAVECVVLVGVALVPSGPLDALANVLVSFVSAVQMQSFRAFQGNPCATTMCTGNLRSGTHSLFLFLCGRDRDNLSKAGMYYILIAVFVLGALTGGLCALALGDWAVLPACLPLLLAFALMFREETGANQQPSTRQS